MIWSNGGRSHESVMVVELMEMMEKLSGGAVGAIRKDVSSNTVRTSILTHTY